LVGKRVTHRPSLHTLRSWILDELDDTWQTPSDLRDRLGYYEGCGGSDWYRIALILERLANDGRIEIRAGGRVRRFRRRQPC
jgi:hypothetical protein